MSEDTIKNEAFENENIQNEQTSTVINDETTVQTDKPSEDEPKAPPTAEEQIAQLNDKYIRLYSEFDNFRKRTNKEKLDLISTASSSVLKDMLSILDDFDRAIVNNQNVEDVTILKEGFGLISSKFKNILETKGLKAMEAKGEAFNPDIHEAIANVPAPSEDLKGKVVDDVEKGYYLNDKVIRFAKVVVGQ